MAQGIDLAYKLPGSQSDQASVGRARTSTIHGGPTLQPPGLKGSTANATTGQPQRSSVHASQGQSQVGSTVGPSWMILVPVHPMDAQCDWDMGPWEARSTCRVLCLLFIVLLGGCCDGECHCHDGMYLLLHQCLNGWCKSSGSHMNARTQGLPEEHFIVMR